MTAAFARTQQAHPTKAASSSDLAQRAALLHRAYLAARGERNIMAAEEKRDDRSSEVDAGAAPRPEAAAAQPADAPDVMPPHPLPPPDPNERPDGNNATIHHPDPHAKEHPARQDHKEPGPYVTGNY